MTGRRHLLDTNTLLWLVDPTIGELGAETRRALQTSTACHYSAASIWELMIKASRGRLTIDAAFFAALESSGLRELPVNTTFARQIDRVQLAHADPFDRLICAQAATEGLTLVTTDKLLLTAPEVKTLDARR